MLRSVGRLHNPQAAASDFLETVVEPKEAAANDKERSVRKFRTSIIAQVRRIDAHGETKALGEEEIGSERGLHCIKERHQDGCGSLRIILGANIGTQGGGALVEVRIVKRCGWVEARAEQIRDLPGNGDGALRRCHDALNGKQQAVAVHQVLMRKCAQTQDEFSLIKCHAFVAICKPNRFGIDPLDSSEIVGNLLPRGAGGVDRLPVLRLDHKPEHRHGSERWISNLVKVGALNIDSATAQNMGAALQHGARTCVGKRNRHARQLTFKFRFGLNGGAFTTTDRLQQQSVLVEAVRGQRGDVVGGATSKVCADGRFGPVLGLIVRKRDRRFEFVGLLRSCASERRAIAEFKGVKHNGAVLRAVDLCCTQRRTHGQRSHHFSQHAGLVAFANNGPLAAVITVQRQVQRLTGRARGDDGAQVVCHFGC